MKNIFVLGYPHSGTSIVRHLIGSHPDVGEPIREALPSWVEPDEFPDKEFVVTKSAPADPKFLPLGDVNVLVIRDPRDSLASLRLRGPESRAFAGDLERWCAWALEWKREANRVPPGRFPYRRRGGNVVPVKYEDLFVPGNLAHLIRLVGLPECPDLLDHMRETKTPINFNHVPTDEPPRGRHEAFRSWQINQPFENMSGQNRGALSKEEISLIGKTKAFQAVYG